MSRDDRVVITLTLGRWESNAVLIIDRTQASAVVVDPGEGAQGAVEAVLSIYDAKLSAVLLTHGHLDHLWAAPQLARDHGAEVLLHRDDAWLWRQPAAAFGAGDEVLASMGVDWQIDGIEPRWIVDGDQIRLGDMRVQAVHTPGHTPGHVVYLLHDAADVAVIHASRRCDGVDFDPRSVTDVDSLVTTPGSGDVTSWVATAPTMLSGDLLFAGSVGRTDLVSGSTQQLFASLDQLFARHDDDVLVVPGHGPFTSMGAERASNPFVRQALHANR